MPEYINIRCESKEKYRNELIKCKKSLKDPENTLNVEETVNHENWHVIAAKILGYSPLYCARIMTTENIILDATGYLDFKENIDDIKKEHMIKILLAPPNPSEEDLGLAGVLATC